MNSNVLSLAAIIISATIGIPSFCLSLYEILWNRRWLINKTWKNIEKYFQYIEIINQWNSNVFKNKRWEEYIDQMLQQGLLWFTSKEILNGFISPYDFDKISIFKIKLELEKESILNIKKICKKWKLLKNKAKCVIELLLNFGFIIKESKYFDIYQYSSSLFSFEKLNIEKTSITFIENLDINRLWNYKNFLPYEPKGERISLKEIEKKDKSNEKKNLQELKNKKNFIFNIKFKNFENAKEQEFKSKLKTFSIHFKNNEIVKIETIFDWDQFYDSKHENIDEFIEAIKLIKRMFQIKNILPLMSKAWIAKNNEPKPYVWDSKFINYKKLLFEFEKKEGNNV